MTFPICEHCRPLLIDLLEQRIRRVIRRVLEAARADHDNREFSGLDPDDYMLVAECKAFHFMALKRIIQGEHTSGVFDDFGAPKMIDGPLFAKDQA